MKIYHHPLSGHSHRVRLFCSLLGLPVELVEVDLKAGAHRTTGFLEKNAFGQVPVLEDGEVLVPDSNAILVYLAKKAGRVDWLPDDARAAAAVQRWLSVAAGEVAYGPAAARLITLFHAKFDAEEVIARAHVLLARLDAQLGATEWLAGDHPTIADVAIYSYVARAPEGNVDLSGYPNVTRFLRRVEALPGFIPFAPSAVGLAAAG